MPGVCWKCLAFVYSSHLAVLTQAYGFACLNPLHHHKMETEEYAVGSWG